MSITITPHFATQIGNANRQALTNVFSSLSSNFPQGVWHINNTHDSQYIAASTITHLHDAWSYFGRALNAVLNNDTFTARHLAYYAELRAANSLLATEGIGVFDKEHFYVDNSGNHHLFTRQNGNPNELGTHTMVWLALDCWSTQPKAKTLLEKIIIINGIDLSTWIGNYKASNWGQLTNEIFKKVGIDLQMMAHDREIRNSVSYAPSELNDVSLLSPKDNYEFVFEIWNLLEPSGTGSFNQLDKLILKQTLQLIDVKDHRTNFKKQRKERSIMIDKTLDNSTLAHEYLNFLSNNDQNIVISKASKIYPNVSDSLLDPENHLQVLGRTLLLLRLATGSVQLLLKDASINFTDIDFWVKKIIQQNGLCLDSDINSIVPEELWNDMSDIALDDVRLNLNSGINDFNEMKKDLSYASLLMSEGERAMLWGLSY